MYHIAGKFGGHYIWQIGCFGLLAIFKFGDSPTAHHVSNRRTPRLISGCEHLLELQLTCKCNEIEVLKVRKVWMYLKWRAACEDIIFTSKFGHRSLEKN